MSTEPSHLSVAVDDGIHIVQFADRKILDELSIQEISTELLNLVRKHPAAVQLILDFRLVEHLSSAALGMLVTVNKEVNSRRGKLCLTDIRPQILEVFKITRLNKLFTIYDSVEEAKTHLRPA